MLRVFNHYFSSRKLTLFVTETAAIAVSCMAGAAMLAHAFAPAHEPFHLKAALPAFLVLSAGFVASFQFAAYLFDLYDLRIAQEDRAQGSRILKAAAVTAVVMGLSLLAVRLRFPEGAILGGAMGALVGAGLVRAGLRALVGEPAPVLIVGSGMKARALQKLILEQGEDGFEIAALYEPPRENATSLPVVAAQHDAKFVVLALDEPRGVVKAEELVRCRFAGMRVYEAAGFCERVLRRIPIASLRASELAFSDELTVSHARRFLKRAFDFTVASVLFLLAAPLMLLLAVLIRLDSEGPILYSQERVGLDGKAYRLWKFRSMRVDAEKDGAVWAKTNDDRVTRVGRVMRKTRMDELPQVFNVLFGDMSFVGPRPERPVFVDQLKQAIPFYGLREGVKPGITGWAQIRYPYGASVDDARNKLEFDLYYVKNGSLFLDLAIIFHTVRHVLLGRGAR
jgi:exopolysaccharide biosynthesis polyprenyl glycosylphosphotransferase